MSGYVYNHPLARDLPELSDAIHKLKTTNKRFENKMTEYETLDKEIVRIEQGIENMGDLELDGMKMKRVKMKDQLTEMLRNAT